MPHQEIPAASSAACSSVAAAKSSDAVKLTSKPSRCNERAWLRITADPASRCGCGTRSSMISARRFARAARCVADFAAPPPALHAKPMLAAFGAPALPVGEFLRRLVGMFGDQFDAARQGAVRQGRDIDLGQLLIGEPIADRSE